MPQKNLDTTDIKVIRVIAFSARYNFGNLGSEVDIQIMNMNPKNTVMSDVK